MKQAAKTLIEHLSSPEAGSYSYSLKYQSCQTDDQDENEILEYITIEFDEKNAQNNIKFSLRLAFNTSALLKNNNNLKAVRQSTILDAIQKHFDEAAIYLIDHNYTALATKVEEWIDE